MAIVKILTEPKNKGWKIGDHIELDDKLAKELEVTGDVQIISINKKEEPEFIPQVKSLEVKPKKAKKKK